MALMVNYIRKIAPHRFSFEFEFWFHRQPEYHSLVFAFFDIVTENFPYEIPYEL